MSKTLRDKIREMVHDHFDILDTRGKGMEGFLDLLEKEIKEAEERGYERCKQEKEMEEAGEGW